MLNKQSQRWLVTVEMKDVMTYIVIGFLVKEIILHLVFYVFSGNLNQYVYDPLPISEGLTAGYMLFTGFMKGAFTYFPKLIQQGVTRKNAFIGNIYGIMIGVMVLVLLAAVNFAIQQVIFQSLDIAIPQESNHIYQLLHFSGDLEALSGHYLLDGTPLAFLSRWIMTMVTFGLTIFLHYIIGWMVGIGFYRDGMVHGVVTLLYGLLFYLLGDFAWGTGLFSEILGVQNNLVQTIDPFISWIVSIVLTLLLTVSCLWIIRKKTREMKIKV